MKEIILQHPILSIIVLVIILGFIREIIKELKK